MTARDNENQTDFLDIVFAVLAFLLVTGTILIAIGGVYYSFIHPSF